jgi:hypothetical protein
MVLGGRVSVKEFSSSTSRSPSCERRRWKGPRRSPKSAQSLGCTTASVRATAVPRSWRRKAHQKPSAEPQSCSTRTTG